MFIETEATPNPATLKFLPGREVLGDRGTADFTSVEEASGRSPLAERLFGLGEVARVFFGSDFVTVTKTLDTDWQTLRPQVLGAIMEQSFRQAMTISGGDTSVFYGSTITVTLLAMSVISILLPFVIPKLRALGSSGDPS